MPSGEPIKGALALGNRACQQRALICLFCCSAAGFTRAAIGPMMRPTDNAAPHNGIADMKR